MLGVGLPDDFFRSFSGLFDDFSWTFCWCVGLPEDLF